MKKEFLGELRLDLDIEYQMTERLPSPVLTLTEYFYMIFKGYFSWIHLTIFNTTIGYGVYTA